MKYTTKTYLLVIILTLTCSSVNAQIVEDFSDGDFNNNPVWLGDVGEFDASGFDLKLISSGTNDSYVSTPSTLVSCTTWEFFVHLGFNPTSGNKAFVYLMSDQGNLESSLNGYYVLVGNTEDEISLYRQDGSSSSEIIDGVDDTIDASSVNVRIRVTRDELGNWELFYDNTGGASYTSAGTILDNTYTTSSYFGFQCDYTSSNASKFNFDDISVTNELDITEVSVQVANTLTVVFDKNVDQTSSENPANYTIDNGITVNSSTRSAVSNNEVLLSLSALTTSNYNITVSNVADECSSTPLATPIVTNFSYVQLTLEQVTTISANELQLTFNDELDEASAENISNYSVDNTIGSPSTAVVDPSDKKILNLTFSESFQPLSTYTLAYGGLLNKILNSQIEGGTTTQFTYVIPLVVETVEVLSKNQAELTFNLDLDESTAEVISNYFIDNGIGNPQSAVRNDVDQNKVILIFGDDLQENSYTINIDNVEDTGNNAIAAGSTSSFNYLPVEIVGLSIIDNTNVQLTFNQEMDLTTAENEANYVVDFEIGAASSAIRDVADFEKVTLTFSTEFVNNDYQLTVNGVENSSGNAQSENIVAAVEFLVQTNFRSIVINEILADPSPIVGLPNSEFIELMNISDKTINIGGFDLSDGNIEGFALAPNGQVILTPTANTSLFESLGDVIGVSSWNTLTNGGEQILLTDNLGNLVDSLTFSSDWHEEGKKDGGWSLEQINPGIQCNYSGNWSSSSNVVGGTPGAQNSNFDNSPDVVGPNLTDVVAVDANTIKATFNEPIDENSTISANYTISTDAIILGVESIMPSRFSVELGLDNPLISGNVYEISIAGVTDCAGNQPGDNSFSLDYDIEPPKLDRIIISSVNKIGLLFDEALLESIAEDENNYLINNGLGNPTSAILSEVDNSKVILTFESDFTFLQQNTLTIEKLEDQKENALSSPFQISFSYDQGIGSVIVRSVNQLDLTYNRPVGQASPLSVLNYSVDDGVGSPKLIYADQNDENLFHLVFQNNFDDNKKLTLTTENIKDEQGQFIPTPEILFIYDTRPPKVDHIVVANSTTLEVLFDEKVERLSAESVENYSYEEVFSSSRSLAENDSTVVLEFHEPFEKEVTYELFIDNVKDVSGNEITSRIKKEFAYDIFPPQLDSILVLSSTELILIFSEHLDIGSAETVTNYLVGETLGNPSSARMDLEYKDRVYLSFDSVFPELSGVSITISNLKDAQGNVPTDAIESSFNFNNFNISHISAISATTIELGFNKIPGIPASREVSNYSINQSQAPESIEADGLNVRKLVVELEEALEDNSENTLSVVNLTDEQNQPISTEEYNFSFDSRFSTIQILNGNTLELTFEVGLDHTVVPEVATFKLSPDNKNPIVIIPDLEENKVVRLVFENNLEAGVEYSLNWPQLTNEFGNLLPAFSAQFSKDEVAPEIVRLTPVSKQSIQVVFSEPLNAITAEILSNYELSPKSGNIESTEYDEKSNSVFLEFSEVFADGTDYTLNVSNIKDKSGNPILATSSSFNYQAPYVPIVGDLLITEIMADPSPPKGLPEVEYIEIYNNSEKEIVLDQVILSDRTNQTHLSGDTLNAKSYALLVSSSNSGLFSNSNVVSVSGFPSLGNAGDSLVLSLWNETVLDYVAYTDDWYRDESKKDGGYSFEKLTLDKKCLPRLNWIASIDENGGTPGTENSLFNTEPDQSAPEIVEIEFDSEKSFNIIFSEPINSESIQNGTYAFSGGLSVGQLVLSGEEINELTLTLTQPPTIGQLYSLTISGVTDCAGNEIETFAHNFGAGEKPAFNDILITEIMADPDPEIGLPQSEYLELYNASEKNIELSGITIKDELGLTTLPSTIILPNSYLLLIPPGSAGLFDNTEVLPVSGWLSLSNSGETISIYNNLELVYSVSYDKDWYKDSSKEDGGWALEMVDTNNPCGQFSNWTASIDTNGGTPGFVNSVMQNNPDNLGPQLLSAISQDDKTLKLIFDEKLHPTQFDNASFTISPELGIQNTILKKPASTEVYLSLFDQLTPNVEYTITVSILTDCIGKFIRNEANSAKFYLPEEGQAGDIVINEILFNPRSGGVDFVEVYNKSDKAINLKKWQLASYGNDGEIDPDVITDADLIFGSGEFLVFTPDPTVLKADYPTSDETVFIEVSPFPGYSDSHGSVILLDSLDNIIDLFDYDRDFHFNLLDNVDGVSLERINFDGNSNDQNNWKSAASTAGFATPGLMNSQFKLDTQVSGTLTIEPKVFIPDNTGMNDFTTINYELQNSGSFANVNIYDAAGRLVKTIVQGDLLSSSGFFTWDGTDNSGSRARAGYYAIYFETFDANGNKDIMKETVVVGVRF